MEDKRRNFSTDLIRFHRWTERFVYPNVCAAVFISTYKTWRTNAVQSNLLFSLDALFLVKILIKGNWIRTKVTMTNSPRDHILRFYYSLTIVRRRLYYNTLRALVTWTIEAGFLGARSPRFYFTQCRGCSWQWFLPGWRYNGFLTIGQVPTGKRE